MFGKRDEQAPAQEYRGNVCPPPPPTATPEELEESAELMADILDTALDMLDNATRLMTTPVVDEENKRTSWSGWFPRFPQCGQQVEEELFKAKASIIEANKMVAVQGYAAQRRNRRSE